MSRLSGTGASFKVGGTVISGFKEWSIDARGDAIDVTGFDSSGAKQFVAGLTEWSGSVNAEADDGANGKFAGAGQFKPGDTITGTFYINSTKYYSGSCIITGVSPKASASGAVEWTVTFQGTGTLTYPA